MVGEYFPSFWKCFSETDGSEPETSLLASDPIHSQDRPPLQNSVLRVTGQRRELPKSVGPSKVVWAPLGRPHRELHFHRYA